jgi:hypothetical protein
MGLGIGFLHSLIALKRAGHLEGTKRIVEIGAQQLGDTLLQAPELAELYGLFGRTQPYLGELSGDDFTNKAPPAEPFWRSLGFDYAAIDFGGHRNSIALDLNRDSVPGHLRGAFDFVVNAGTTEHVANQDNAFRVIHDLTADGGIMLHEVPSSGVEFNHGLIAYNPKFFHILCRDNAYRVLLDAGGVGAIRLALWRPPRGSYRTPMDLPDLLVPSKPYDMARILHRRLRDRIRRLLRS